MPSIRRRNAAVLAVATLLVSCGPIVEPFEFNALVEVDLVGGPAAPPDATAPPTTTRVGDVIEVVGLFDAPTACQDFRAPLAIDGTRLMIFVESQERPVDCLGAEQQFAYRARYPEGGSFARVTVYHGRFDRRSEATMVVDTIFSVVP
jgi:hypothetical protein